LFGYVLSKAFDQGCQKVLNSFIEIFIRHGVVPRKNYSRILGNHILSRVFGTLTSYTTDFSNFRRLLVLDRDNTLIWDKGYTFKINDFLIIEENIEYLIKLQKIGWGFVVFTNQSAIARGLCSEDDVENFNAHLVEGFAKRGVYISAVVYCRHLRFCFCRKPSPGMLYRILLETRIPREKVVVLGDKQSDVNASERLGIEGHLFTVQGSAEIFEKLMGKN
jgi:D-glycero-D-manno-heptose 1,7-bisphosphate phosphatase